MIVAVPHRTTGTSLFSEGFSEFLREGDEAVYDQFDLTAEDRRVIEEYLAVF